MHLLPISQKRMLGLYGLRKFTTIVVCSSFCFSRDCLGQFCGSDLRCTLRIYFDNVTLTLHNVTLMRQKPCQHNNKCDNSKTNSYKWSLGLFNKFYWKIIIFIYSVDKAFLVNKIIDFNRLQYYFPLRHFRLIKLSFFIHSTKPYIHQRLDSWIEPKLSDCLLLKCPLVAYIVKLHDKISLECIWIYAAKDIFLKKNISRLIYHMNYMLANNSHDISSFILFCQESAKFKSVIRCKFEVVLYGFIDLEVSTWRKDDLRLIGMF